MSNLTGYDSECIGFDSVKENKNKDSACSTQTVRIYETGSETQTNTSQDCGSNVCPSDFDENHQEKALTSENFPPPGLNEFLRRIVPAMLVELDNNATDITYNSSDSEEEDLIAAKLFQDIELSEDFKGSGDGIPTNVLALSWSSVGNSLAISLGSNQHENWCCHDGIIRIFSVKTTFGDKLVHTLDIRDKNCITTVKYHPTVAALLACGNASGDVTVWNLRDANKMVADEMKMIAPQGFHESFRISSLQWADATLTNTFLQIHISNSGKRRSASDQILLSAGCDGFLNVWQVNVTTNTFQNVLCYRIGGKSNLNADITCFDFYKSSPLRPTEEKEYTDIFVVGSKCGKLYLCHVKDYERFADGNKVYPVCNVLEGHLTCVVDVAFSFQKTNIFASISMDSEVHVYDVKQTAPVKVICMDDEITSMGWVPNNSCLLIVGLAKVGRSGQILKVYNVASGKNVAIEGLTFSGKDDVTVTAVAVNQSGICRVAAGDNEGTTHIYDMPFRRVKLTAEDLEF